MNKIELYIGKVIVIHTLLVLVVLLTILGFSEFMLQLRLIKGDYTLEKGVIYTLFRLPAYAYEMFPVTLLIGVLLGMGSLSNHAELTVLRVTGWSIGRIFIASLKTILIMWVIVTITGEMVAPKSEFFAKQMREEALNSTFSISEKKGFWIKDTKNTKQKSYINVGKFINDKLLIDIEIYTLLDRKLIQITLASKAVFVDKAWKLYNVRQQNFKFQYKNTPFLQKHNLNLDKVLLDINIIKKAQMDISLPLSPGLLKNLNVDKRYMGVFEIYKYIQHLEVNSLDAEEYKLVFWRKISSPLVVIAMLSLVFPLVFGFQRQVSMGQRVFVGILIGMSFYLFNNIIGDLSILYNIPSIIGAMLPSTILIFLSYLLIKKMN